jgi:hypothetical protein
MTDLPRSERHTHNRVIPLFTDENRPDNLGNVYLGDLSEEPRNRCLRSADLELNLERRGYPSYSSLESSRGGHWSVKAFSTQVRPYIRWCKAFLTKINPDFPDVRAYPQKSSLTFLMSGLTRRNQA